MDYDIAVVIVFALLLTLFLWWQRKRIDVQKIIFPVLYFVLYKTKIGIKLMERMSQRFPRLIHWISLAGIATGFLGMAFIVYAIASNTIMLFTRPEVSAGIQLVLPIKAKGIFFAPFDYWILGILLIASVHEFMHGVVARRYKIPVKSSGFAFLCVLLPIIPAAFVEPDEKVLSKKKISEQLGVFAAGPFANIFSAGILALLLIFVVQPVMTGWINQSGILLAAIDKDSPAAAAGMRANELLRSINNHDIRTVEDITRALKDKKVGETISIATNVSAYTLTLGQRADAPEKTYMGVQLEGRPQALQEISVTDILPHVRNAYGTLVVTVLLWIFKLVQWLFLLSLGIGMFNLLPLGPIDGGQMFRTIMNHWFPNHGIRVWKIVSFALLAIILVNFLIPFVR